MGHLSPLGEVGVAPRGAGDKIQNSASERFCSMTHRIHTQSLIDVGPVVSELQSFQNVEIARTYGRTDGRTDGQTDIWSVLQVISALTTQTHELYILLWGR